MVEVADANSLVNFFAECFSNRAVAATKMNDRSSRSHAIYTVLINRTLVDVSEVGDKVSWVGCMQGSSIEAELHECYAGLCSAAAAAALASAAGAADSYVGAAILSWCQWQ